MSRTGFAGLAALALGFTAAVVAAPVAIDSEQKANAAVIAALRLKGTPSGDLQFISTFARGEAERALQRLAAATTPGALMNARNGIALPCADGGNLTARMARALPRLLKLSWNACKYTDIDGYAGEQSGSAEVLLLSDTFSPEKVGGLKFGTTSSDFVEKRLVVYDDQITDEARSINLRMLGVIPMKRAFPQYGLFIGNFAYELTGFYQEHNVITLPDIPLPPIETTYRLMPESVFATGSVTYNQAKTHSVEETRFLYGKVRSLTQQDGYPDSATQYEMNGFKARREFDLAGYTWQESLDGRIDFKYPAPDVYSAGCLSGSYVFRTRAPIAHSGLSPYEIDSGDLVINNSTVAQFYTAATVPAGLPIPANHNLIHLEVANVGTFNYDSNGRAALVETAQCWN